MTSRIESWAGLDSSVLAFFTIFTLIIVELDRGGPLGQVSGKSIAAGWLARRRSRADLRESSLRRARQPDQNVGINVFAGRQVGREHLGLEAECGRLTDQGEIGFA